MRVALVCDYLEENWPSMDLTGEMILNHLDRELAGQVAAARICPPFRHRLTRWPVARRLDLANNTDRLLNRFWDYPGLLRGVARRGEYDLYHLVDHSYSQLVHALPAGRSVVTCHDLDTFRCVLEPEREPRPRWFRAMAQRILDGLRQAAAVICDSEATRQGLLAHGLGPGPKLHVVSLGTHPECGPDPDPAADAAAERLLGPFDPDAPPDLLHVGSNIPRKRIDVLLATFAGVRRAIPGARLIKVGGALTADQEGQARELGVAEAIRVLPFFHFVNSPRAAHDRATLAAVYRRAALVLQPSEAEGFGLPVAEALACGAPLLVSDIAVLREVGGDAPVYCPVGDVPAWTESALALLDERRRCSDTWRARRAAGLAQARRYTWSEHVHRLAAIYHDALDRLKVRPTRPR
jgi:glycosyltransferase involved in cell wall biosynthesis